MECLANVPASSQTVKALIVSCCEGSGVTNLAVKKATEYLQQEDQDASQLVVIGQSPAEVPASVSEFFVRMFRKFGLHRNERETLLGPADQLVATQLVLASQNQKDLGNFDVDVSKVLEVNSKLIHSKLSSVAGNIDGSTPKSEEASFNEFINNYNSFIRHCNSVDWMDVLTSVHWETNANVELQNYIQGSNFLVLNPQDNFIETNLIGELAKGKECAILSVSQSLNESFSAEVNPHSIELCVEKCSTEKALSCVSSAVTLSLSISEVFVVHIFLAYLELLVNSRSELALARVINVPDRKLDHGAFTDIKHEAKKRNLSMYQTIISFATRVRLGGKSYAPGKDCPLVQHSEGLGRFTDFMDKLQTITEEDAVAESAVKRVVNLIKTNVRGSSQQFRTNTVEKVASHLLEQATVIMTSKCLEPDASPTHNASDGGSLAGRRTLRIIRTLLDHFASLPSTLQSVDVLTDAFAPSQKTPVRFPSLMSKFRSPEDCDEPCLSERLVKRIAVNESKTKKRLSIGAQSCFNWASSEAMSSDCHLISSVDHMSINASRKPNCTKRILESSRDQENVMRQPEQQNDGRKPSASSDSCTSSIKATLQQTNSNTKESTSKRKAEMQPIVAKKSKASTKSKVIPQVKGQQKLGSFFRV